MRYMCIWSVKPENIEKATKRFQKDEPKAGEGVRIIGWWDEIGTGKGYTLLEADDPVSAAKYFGQLSDVADQKVAPVIEREELRVAMKAWA